MIIVKNKSTIHTLCILSFLQVDLCKPKGIYICDGSEEEATELKEKMVDRGMLIKCDKMDNW